MNMCKKYRDLVLSDLYGELSMKEARRLKMHLDSCEGCAEEYKKTEAVLEILDKRKRPDPGKDYWDNYWNRLHQRIRSEGVTPTEPSAWKKIMADRFEVVPKWAFQAAAALILVAVGFFIGSRYFGRSPEGTLSRQAELQGTPESRSSLVHQAQDYIERSKILILAMVNFNPDEEDPYALNLPYQKQVSGRLVKEAILLKEGLTDPAHKKMRELVVDLELILLQIANLESENDLAAVEFVKSGVDQTGILLRINTMEIAGEPGAVPSKTASKNRKKI
ncbi:MAG: zf-HC2 domain-containing protein [Candidatus Aminicenantes bacterium]|nr:zf-HC2 domain-containing protein [Candidatus Aminicenantes bacterium]